MIWLAGGNPVTIEEYKKIPLVEYYAILDAKLGQIKEQIKKNGR